jgi:uncharacterized protein YggE
MIEPSGEKLEAAAMYETKPILLLILIVALLAGIPAPAMAADGSPGTISVSGEAVVKVAPDEVVITLGVESFDEDLNRAKQDNDARVERVIRLCERFGIESKHVQTDFISIEPHYQDGYWREVIEGYFVRKNIVITLRDLTAFDQLLTEVLGAGANYVHGIEFRTTDLRKYRDQARTLAVNAAKEKAAAIADELGLELGNPQSIREEGVNWWSGYGASWWGSRYGGVSQNVVQNAGEMPSEPYGATAPGQIGIRAQVSITFYLE